MNIWLFLLINHRKIRQKVPAVLFPFVFPCWWINLFPVYWPLVFLCVICLFITVIHFSFSCFFFVFSLMIGRIPLDILHSRILCYRISKCFLLVCLRLLAFGFLVSFNVISFSFYTVYAHICSCGLVLYRLVWGPHWVPVTSAPPGAFSGPPLFFKWKRKSAAEAVWPDPGGPPFYPKMRTLPLPSTGVWRNHILQETPKSEKLWAEWEFGCPPLTFSLGLSTDSCTLYLTLPASWPDSH